MDGDFGVPARPSAQRNAAVELGALRRVALERLNWARHFTHGLLADMTDEHNLKLTLGLTCNDANDADTAAQMANEGQNFPVITSVVPSGGSSTVTTFRR